MRVSTPTLVAFGLAVSAALLGSLVPGGPIETRHFSHISPLILSAFNTFLTALGMGSLVLSYFAFRRRSFALWSAAFCGAAYLAVYLLDLGRIFPTSPDSMPHSLWVIEVLGAAMAVPIILLSVVAARHAGSTQSSAATTRLPLAGLLILLATLLAVGIIWFATNAAMR